MLLHAPAKLNLCLYLGARRADGLHELCSLFEPLALADLITVTEAESDEVICPGVEGENLAARALAGLRQRGWRRPPLRVEIEKRVPVAAGLGGGSGDAAVILRLAAGEVGDLRGLAAELGADVPSQLEPSLALVRGAGERVEPLPEPAAHAAVLLPDGGGLSTAEVFAEANRLGLGREPEELEALATRLREAAGAGASPLSYPELLVNDLAAAARSLRPAIGDALDALREAGAPVVLLSGSGPTAVGLFPDLVAAAGAAEAIGRDDAIVCAAGGGGGGAMKLPGGEAGKGRNRKRLLLAAIAAAIAFGYYLLSQELGHLDLQGLLEDFSNTLGAWTYLLVGVFAFAETGAFVGLVVPGETVMLLGGAVAGQGAIDIYLLIAIAWFSAWAGDTTSFFLGRRLGREFVIRHGPRFGISHERFERVEDYFSRHGGKTIFIGRFISLVRAFAPFIAGSSGMRYRAFVPYSILGTGLWASAHILIGYFFSRSIETAAKYAGKGAFLLATLIVVVAGSIFLYRYFRVAENRVAAVRWMEGHAATRWLVALGRRYRPQLRFLWDRVTPGGTFGLEFTSLMATLAVSLFVLVAYVVVIGRDPGPTPGDMTAMDVVEHLRAAWLTDLSKVVTFLGSGVFTWGLTVVCAALLIARRRWTELGVLLAGMTLITVGFHEIKAAVDRPRPDGALIDTSGSSFPSGHAAHSVLYLWLAVTIVLRLRPGMARKTAVVAAGLTLTILVGLSRVYLNVHYLSDVSGGWALGAACFSFCAAVGLVISEVRQNPRQ